MLVMPPVMPSARRSPTYWIPIPVSGCTSWLGHARDGRDMVTTLRYMPHPEWPLPYDDLGNVVGAGLRTLLPGHPFLSVSFKDGRYKDYMFDAVGPVFRTRAEVDQLQLPERVAQDVVEMKSQSGRPYWGVKYRVRAFHAHSSAVGVASWRPGQSDISIKYEVGTLGGPDESHIARRGLKLFYEIPFSTPIHRIREGSEPSRRSRQDLGPKG